MKILKHFKFIFSVKEAKSEAMKQKLENMKQTWENMIIEHKALSIDSFGQFFVTQYASKDNEWYLSRYTKRIFRILVNIGIRYNIRKNEMYYRIVSLFFDLLGFFPHNLFN